MKKMNRRDFLKSTALTGAALSLTPHTIFANGSPNEKIVVAIMGVRSRGLWLSEVFTHMPNTEIGYICDVDQRYTDKCMQVVSGLQKRKPKTEKDIRKIVEQKDVDAVVMATPDHWHAPGALLAMANGKHVYLEKPCSHNPREGELLIESVKKNNTVFQMGNQRRSFPNVIQMMDELHNGLIGKVYFAKGWYANDRKPIGKGEVVDVPDYLDYDIWQGPAPRTAYRDNIHPYNWHWFWRWGTGEALNNGTHEIDLMRWGMGEGFPSRVVASGGRYHYEDDWEFPDSMVITFDFADGRTFTWESRSSNNYPVEGMGRGVIFYGQEGTVVSDGNSYTVYANDGKRSLIKKVVDDAGKNSDATNTVSPAAYLDGLHTERFLKAIREGTPVNSPADEAHKSVLMCQLGNIAWKTGRALNIDQKTGRILNDEEAMQMWAREYEPGWEPVV